VKLMDLCANLVPLLGVPMSEFTELARSLKEGSSHFDEASEANRLHPEILKGRPGPGGGVVADPFRAAFMLAALMINGPRRDSAKNTWEVWHLNQEGSILGGWGECLQPTITRCPLTGMHLFGDAFKAILADEDLASRVKEVRIGSNGRAEIRFDDDAVSRFGVHQSLNRAGRYLHRVAVLDGFVVHGVCQLLKRES